jgi:RNA polymerase-binding transcription factor DksA
MEIPTAPAPAATATDASPTGDTATVPADIDEFDARLDGVEAALERIDAGTYGRCEGCGTLIDDTTLAADPTAHRCGTCAPVAVGTGEPGPPGPD